MKLSLSSEAVKRLIVAARNVRPGDRICNSLAKDPAYRWWYVTHIERHRSGSVVIRTRAFTTWKHPEEGIAVQRFT